MKRNKMIVKIVALTLVFGFLAAGFAMAAEETITGTLHKDNMGNFSIVTPDGQNYVVEGTKKLDSMEGKTVSVKGTVEQKGDYKAIKIMTMEEVKN